MRSVELSPIVLGKPLSPLLSAARIARLGELLLVVGKLKQTGAEWLVLAQGGRLLAASDYDLERMTLGDKEE